MFIDTPDMELLFVSQGKDPNEQFWQSREELRQIQQFAQSKMISPWAVLACVLTYVVTATEPQYVVPPTVGSPASLNLFTLLVGKSSGGKGGARTASENAIPLNDRETFSAPLGSGEGITKAFAYYENGKAQKLNPKTGEIVEPAVPGRITYLRHRALLHTSEIRSMIAIKERGGSTLVPQLLSAWSGEELGFLNSDPTRSVILQRHTYRFGFVVQAQWANTSELLAEKGSGLPQRFIWAEARDRYAPRIVPDTPKLKPWKGVPILSPEHPLVYLELPSSVVELTQKIRQFTLITGEAPGDDELDGHAVLLTTKVAAAFALLRGELTVTEEDWDLAQVFMENSAATRALAQEMNMSAVRQERNAKNLADTEDQHQRTEMLRLAELKAVERVAFQLCAKIREGKDTRTELLRSLSSRDKPERFNAALELLQGDGRIARRVEPSSGRRPEIERWTIND